MHSQSQFSFGSASTHPWLRMLIMILCGSRILSVLVDPYLSYMNIPTTQTLLALSSLAAKGGFLWQTFTYPLIQSAPQGITIFFLISLSFQMYFLWLIGQSIIDRQGVKSFFVLFLTSVIGVGLVSLAWISLGSTFYPMMGFGPTLLSLFLVWALLHPEATILLFFVIPVRTKTLLSIALGGCALIALSQGDPLFFFAYLSGALIGYLFATASYGLHTPYACMQPWDNKMERLGTRISSLFRTTSATIIDIETGRARVSKDQQFVDEMLEKISRSGRKSLTLWELIKLRFVSWKLRRNG